MGHPYKSLEERFWEKVAKGSPDECWEWCGCRHQQGYGMIVPPRQGRTQRTPRGAHRVAWELMNGAIPDGMCVLHHCDNPPCVNPAHLFLGTHRDNFQDAIKKGRWRPGGTPGERHPQAKLSAADVLNIRRSYTGAWGEKARLAREFRVTNNQIGRILSGRAWKHLLPQSPTGPPVAP